MIHTSWIIGMMTIVIFLTGSCKHQLSSSQSPTTHTDFVYKVIGCAAVETRNVKAMREDVQQPVLPYLLPVEVKGDSLLYNRTLRHLCCRKVQLSSDVKEGTILLTEYWFGMGCKCQCATTVTATLRHIPAGSYQVLVLGKGTDPYDDKTPLATDTIWTGTVRITVMTGNQEPE